MKYSIKKFNKYTGQIVVRFDEIGSEVTVDLPIVNNEYITGNTLAEYLEGFIPDWVVNRSNQIQAGIKNEDYFIELTKQTPEEQKIEQEREVRLIRDRLLNESDWLMLPDTGISLAKVEEFKIYRQQLRDVPQQHGFPENVVWPTVTGEWPNNARTYN